MMHSVLLSSLFNHQGQTLHRHKGGLPLDPFSKRKQEVSSQKVQNIQHHPKHLEQCLHILNAHDMLAIIIIPNAFLTYSVGYQKKIWLWALTSLPNDHCK